MALASYNQAEQMNIYFLFYYFLNMFDTSWQMDHKNNRKKFSRRIRLIGGHTHLASRRVLGHTW